MSHSNISPYPSSVSNLCLSGEKVSSLLQKQIQIQLKSSHGPKEISLSFFDIFKASTKSFCDVIMPARFVIKGSFVSHIFSNEEFKDIDVHIVVDLTHLPDKERIRLGYDFKWAILKGIADLIKMNLEGDINLSKLDNISFEEKVVPLASKGLAPFKIHMLKIGNIPLEYTLVSVVQCVEKATRNYDFNCGALEMVIDSSSSVMIGSYLPEIDRVIEQISRKELLCDSPHEITKKAICRYLSKLTYSGYCDKDPMLLPSLFDGFISRICPSKQDKALEMAL